MAKGVAKTYRRTYQRNLGKAIDILLDRRTAPKLPRPHTVSSKPKASIPCLQMTMTTKKLKAILNSDYGIDKS